MELNVDTKEKSPGVYILSLTGALNTNTYAVLEKQLDALLKTAPDAIVFDMALLNYISSAGVRVILKANKLMKQRNGKVLFTSMQPQIKKVFEIINALPYQKVFASIRELDDYLDAMQKKTLAGDD